MSENKKGFRTGIYAVIVFILISAFLAATVVVTFSNRYMGFHPETIAENYVDTIVQKGDGYNAYKYTLMSKNSKFGDYVIDNFMKPYINDGDEVKKSDLTSGKDKIKTEDATNAYNEAMYPYYTQYVVEYGYDNIDKIFDAYFAKAKEVRQEMFGDEYLDSEILFTVFESNVNTYGESLAGTEAIYDQYDEEKVLVEAVPGVYDNLYGNDYIMTTSAQCKELTEEEMTAYKATMNTQMLEQYKVSVDDINAVDACTVETKLADGTVVATQNLYTVKIGKTWYVDNTTIDTSALYHFNAVA